MLTTRLLHPQLLAALGAAGHGSQVLIADGNYPFGTRANPAAERVYLNLVPGVVDAVTVLEALAGVIPIEAAQGMGPAALTTGPPGGAGRQATYLTTQAPDGSNAPGRFTRLRAGQAPSARAGSQRSGSGS